ncbi:carboxyl transferase domain-containing protein [Kribbella yunnanensis]|uniref:Carboxyl transferase domain-containing protein n=1 Tax=Kribbella yunnanensis TaxID=190194 RepID=A0ABP4UN15_9ACTN
MRRLGARELIQATVDPGSWVSWDEPIVRAGLDPAYAEELAAAEAKAGTDEAVITGRARVEGHDVVLVVGEFRFLGGSVGAETASRVVAAVRRATELRLPVIAATSSGGTRMQEGTPAFVSMIDISRAVVDHKAAGLPYLVYLRHPTTGGVFASWASLGHVAVAEPGALIGFLGPVVYQTLHGRAFPEGVQTAENLVAKGVLDAVVQADELAPVAARALRLLTGGRADLATLPTAPAAYDVDVKVPDAWEAIETTRREDRPGARELLAHVASDVVPLHGTQAGEADSGLLTVVASIRGISCLVIAQDRRAQALKGPLGPASLRAARRGMQLAEQLRLPLVSLIDTPGADLSAEAEEGALAPEIARCLADMVQLSVPTVAVLMGEGCGGGALALLPARRVVAARNAWLSPLPPEGASAILYGTADRAAEMARRQRVRADDLAEIGIVHAVVDESSPAHLDPERFLDALADEVIRQFAWQGLRVPNH